MARVARETRTCPFRPGSCVKRFNDGTLSGVCSVELTDGRTVILCPERFYADNYAVIRQIAETIGRELPLLPPDRASDYPQSDCIAVFGRGWGGELKIPGAGGGRQYVDWVLALLSSGELQEITAIEVQSMDTTGSYGAQWRALMAGEASTPAATAGINWRNVVKRILPQLIQKSAVLQRESFCKRGLTFICPEPVFQYFLGNLGGSLTQYPNLQPASLSFRRYDLGPQPIHGEVRPLVFTGESRTVTNVVAQLLAFPPDVPLSDVYADAIRTSMRRGRTA